MSDFSPDCIKARAAWQQAHDQVKHLIRVKFKAKFALKQAKEIAFKAQDLWFAKNLAWDDYMEELLVNPTFSIKGVTANFQLRTIKTKLTDVVVGSFPVRDKKAHVLVRSGGESMAQNKWDVKASKALAESLKLQKAANEAKKDYETKKAKVEALRKELSEAIKQIESAKVARSKAEAEVLKICGSQKRTIKVNETIVQIDAGFLPSEQEKVIEAFKSLPKSEVKDLKKISLLNQKGKTLRYIDPNTQKEIVSNVQAFYDPLTMGIFYFGPSFQKQERAIKHEVGHLVFPRLKGFGQTIWKNFWEKGQNKLKVPKGKMPSGYAGRTAEEGFAECYAYLRCNKKPRSRN